MKHCEWSRTNTGAAGFGAPIRIARCSVPPSPGRNAISLSVLGLGQRDARLGDTGETGDRGAARKHRLGPDHREIDASPGQRRLGGSERQDQRGRQQRGELGERNGRQLTAFGARRLGTEPGRLGAERGRRIGEVADHCGGQVKRHGDRYRARQRVTTRQP